MMIIYSGCSTKNDRLFQAQNDPYNGKLKSTKVNDNKYQDDLTYEYKISENDRLSVNVFIKSDTNSQQFTSLLSQENNANNSNSKSESGYLVNREGSIILPLLNTVRVAGLTEFDAANLLMRKYRRYIKNPFVIVNITNKRVIVIGEVKKPGIVPIINGRMNLIEVIAQSGDFTDLAERTNIKIIRGNLRNPKVIVVDLTMLKNITKGSLILKPNDIVYIQPRHIKGINKAITEISPLFITISNMLNPFVQRKTLIQ